VRGHLLGPHRPDGRLRENDLRHWLETNAASLVAARITADLGWAALIGWQRRARWISFGSPHLLARVTLWSSSQCQVRAWRRDDGSNLISEDLHITSAWELYGELDHIADVLSIDCVDGDHGRMPEMGGRASGRRSAISVAVAPSPMPDPLRPVRTQGRAPLTSTSGENILVWSGGGR
jgi:hypothetical protein